jgi:hypothetical protein
MISSLPLRWLVVTTIAIALASLVGTAVTRAWAVVTLPASARALPVTGAAARPPRPAPAPVMFLGDTMLGLSGKLRVHFVPATELPALMGNDVAPRPGIYGIPGGVDGHPFSLVALRGFSAKVGSWLGTYRVGYWPAELRRIRSAAYANPTGFVEVTPANEDTYVSEHFQLRDFLTHDQPRVWPKYVVLREALLDKLELVLDDLSRRGIPTWHVVVLSGFRTPAYNLALGDASGRARESRHQFGDAADIIIDADGDGRMDDLDMNGRIDAGDVRVIERSVQRVEREYPALVGGLGLYDSMGPHGPFAHIDVRGAVARWTGASRRGLRRTSPGEPTRASRVARCYATGASAVLCAPIRRRAP